MPDYEMASLLPILELFSSFPFFSFSLLFFVSFFFFTLSLNQKILQSSLPLYAQYSGGNRSLAPMYTLFST